MSVPLLHAARTLALLLALAATAGFAATAEAENAPLTTEQKAIHDMRKSIFQKWSFAPELRTISGGRGTVYFTVNAEGRLAGEPKVTVSGIPFPQRTLVEATVKRNIQKAFPRPAWPKGKFPSSMNFSMPFVFDAAPNH